MSNCAGSSPEPKTNCAGGNSPMRTGATVTNARGTRKPSTRCWPAPTSRRRPGSSCPVITNRPREPSSSNTSASASRRHSLESLRDFDNAKSGDQDQLSADVTVQTDAVGLSGAGERKGLDLDHYLVLRQQVGDLGQGLHRTAVRAATCNPDSSFTGREVGDGYDVGRVGYQADQLVGRRLADDIKHRVNRTAGGISYPVGHALAVQHRDRPDLPQAVLVGLAGGGDYPRASGERDLDGDRSHTACASVDEQRLAGLDVEKPKTTLSGLTGHAGRSRHRPIDGCWLGRPRVEHGVFRLGVPTFAEDIITH